MSLIETNGNTTERKSEEDRTWNTSLKEWRVDEDKKATERKDELADISLRVVTSPRNLKNLKKRTRSVGGGKTEETRGGRTRSMGVCSSAENNDKGVRPKESDRGGWGDRGGGGRSVTLRGGWG